MNDYLNNAKVQAALHARATNWSTCSAFNWTDSPTCVLPIVQKLISSNLRVWIYSGDVDGVVPVTSTRYSIDSLKLPVTTCQPQASRHDSLACVVLEPGGRRLRRGVRESDIRHSKRRRT